MIKRNRKGQSTLEYILLVTAVLAVLIGLMFTPGSPFQSKLNATLTQPLSFANTFVNKLNPN